MKKKVAITFPQTPFIRGGAENLVDMLKKQLIHRGFSAEIISIPFKWYPFEEYYNQMLIWRNIDLLESNGYKIDYVIGTKFPSYFVKHPKKILWLIHQQRSAYDLISSEHSQFKDKPIETKKFRETDTKILNEANKIFTISKTVSKRLKKFNNIDSEVLYHPPKLYGNYYCENFDNYILSVGRLTFYKRVDLLIEAMRFTDKNIKCYIGGEGEQKELLIELINKYKLNDRVKLIGYINDSDLLNLYANSLGVYFSPIDEDLGYITLEAFLSKKPVITSNDSGGVLEFVKNEESGLITNPTPREIAESINKLYKNKNKAIEYGLNGNESVKEINWDSALNRMISEMEKLEG